MAIDTTTRRRNPPGQLPLITSLPRSDAENGPRSIPPLRHSHSRMWFGDSFLRGGESKGAGLSLRRSSVSSLSNRPPCSCLQLLILILNLDRRHPLSNAANHGEASTLTETDQRTPSPLPAGTGQRRCRCREKGEEGGREAVWGCVRGAAGVTITVVCTRRERGIIIHKGMKGAVI